jgi:hypothetical protein
MPTVVELLERRRELQAEERSAAPTWATVTYQGRPVELVFTTPTGGPVLRQTVAKVVKQAAKSAGISGNDQLGTHAGRRSVVTTLFVDGREALEDIARFVGEPSRAGVRSRWDSVSALVIVGGGSNHGSNRITRQRASAVSDRPARRSKRSSWDTRPRLRAPDGARCPVPQHPRGLRWTRRSRVGANEHRLRLDGRPSRLDRESVPLPARSGTDPAHGRRGPPHIRTGVISGALSRGRRVCRRWEGW